MEPEQLQNFNDRLSQWVASQGFWFQIRHSTSGSGMKSRVVYHLMRLAFRLLILLILLALGSWIFLVKRTDSPRFQDQLQAGLQGGLSASTLELKGIKTKQGQLKIKRVVSEGGPDTFFSTLEARNIRTKMGLLDGLVGVWNTDSVSISRLDIDLRAGADDEESAGKLAEALFRKFAKVEVRNLHVKEAFLRWGFSDRTRGNIESSELKMQRTETGWRMVFEGGSFQQSWLRSLDIVRLVVLCDPGGVVFEKAEFRQGTGTVDLSGLRVIAGERPEVVGTARIRNLSLDGVLPSTFSRFVEGAFSGDFRVFGSTNSSDGVGFEGQVILGGENVITLRERIPLMKALSVVDYARNYRRIDFDDGSFQLKTIGGGMEISELDLKAKDLVTMKGGMKVRLPTNEEIQLAVASGQEIDGSGDVSAGAEESKFSLDRAVLAAKSLREGKQGAGTGGLFDRMGLGMEAQYQQSQASVKMSRMLRYDGAFEITLPGDAFDRAGQLDTLYPVDPETGRIPMEVPVEGSLYELTVKLAEHLYEQGQR